MVSQSCTDSLETIEEKTTPVIETRNIADSDMVEVEALSSETSLPKVLVNCTNLCITPLFVTFTSPNYTKISNIGPVYDAIINPLFVTEDDKFQVFVRIEHGGCSKNHTVTITNCANHTETLYSGINIGTIEYRGFIPLGHISDTERIAVQLR